MKYFSISEFAKLHGTTPETLRHYDRIGLLNPAYIDENTNYRYYSILQYEKLRTIIELRQLGISIEIIKDYFENRNVNKSKEILKSAYKDVHSQIKVLANIEKILKNKIEFLDDVLKPKTVFEPIIKTIPERYLITNGYVNQDENDLIYQWSLLEKNLNEISPILATNRVGWLIKQQMNMDYKDLKNMPFIFTYEKADDCITLPKGDYACIYCEGIKSQEKAFEMLLKFTKESGYITEGDVISFVWADISVTGSNDERSVEMQIKISPKK